MNLKNEDSSDNYILNYSFTNQDICNGVYKKHIFEGMTLAEILKEVDGCFKYCMDMEFLVDCLNG